MRLIYSSILFLFLSACATPHNRYDPLEPINRPIFDFNQDVDRAFVRPITRGWEEYVPEFIQAGVSHFFDNIAEIYALPAALLQGQFKTSLIGLGRITINMTLGGGGLFDPASEMHISKNNADFGQALAYWGVPSGPYLVLPFLGPYTLRDVVNPAVAQVYGPASYIKSSAGKISYTSLYMVDTRVRYLKTDKVIEDQVDPYIFLRDTYLQYRWSKSHQGHPPYPLPLWDQDNQFDPGPTED